MSELISNVMSLLKKMQVSSMLISNIADIRYLSGFTGSTAYMIITQGSAVFYTDGRYEVQSEAQVDKDIERVIVSNYGDFFEKECAKHKSMLLQPSCTVDISMSLSSIGVDVFLDDNDSLRQMRMVKSHEEIKLIKAQYDLAGTAFLKSIKKFKIGQSEREWAAFLEYNIKKQGADGTSFETIVASGERGALPHGVASEKRIKESDPVIIDFGSRLGYTSDYTRMVYSGRDKEVLKVIEIVRSALLKSIEGLSEGIVTKNVDKIARDYIESKGYGKYFNHSLGHGVGLDVHELPVLNKAGEINISDGMVFTIEPGIYLPGKFGVRLEDTVYMKGGKAELMSTKLPDYVYKVFLG